MPSKVQPRLWLLLSVLVGSLSSGCLPDRDPDVNDDGTVNILDVSLTSSCLGADPATNLQCQTTDINRDGAVDPDDVDLVVARFGESGFPVADRTPPRIEVLSPGNLALTNLASITVSGSVDDANATVEVDGTPVALVGGTPPTFSAEVDLAEGENTLSIVATDEAGNVATASVNVTRDSTPPRVTIDSPLDGSTTNDPAISVAGMINDIVVGTVNNAEANVFVNGQPASVGNRSFLLQSLSLAPGENRITAIGTDRAGNTDSASVSVTFEPLMDTSRLRLVSGDGQQGPVETTLPGLLVVEALDANETPIPGAPVVFRVRENDGALTADGRTARSVLTSTDASGRASAQWTLGSRAGAGNNVVSAASVGLVGEPRFTAIAEPSAPADIAIDSGELQTGVVSQPLPDPFVVVVTDASGNRLPGAQVTFSVLEGGGNLSGQTELVVATDSDGRALAVLTLGPQEGIENNVASAAFEGLSGLAATFSASGKVPGDASLTSVSGVVLDNSDVPVPGVAISIHDTPLVTTTDSEGLFSIAAAPVGRIHLDVDGSTATRPGNWPHLEFELVTVAGRDNDLGRPIYLLPLNDESAVFVDEATGGTVTLDGFPGFSIEVLPGSTTFPDGSTSGIVSATLVHADKVPMAPSAGQQPRFVITVQPPGALFDPPAKLTVPNTDGLCVGKVTELFSFDHDLGQFVAIGTGTVSDDGTVVESDPGVGILKAGWHFPATPTPPDTGCVADCPDCHSCDGRTCVPDDDAAPEDEPGDCRRPGGCSAGSPSFVADDSDVPGGQCERCQNGQVANNPDGDRPGNCYSCQGGELDFDDSDVPIDVVEDCRRPSCRFGEVIPIIDDDDAPACKLCQGGEQSNAPNGAPPESPERFRTSCCFEGQIFPNLIQSAADFDRCPEATQGRPPATNGCSVPFRDFLPLFVDNPMLNEFVDDPLYNSLHDGGDGSFLPACQPHDRCYSTCGSSRDECDQEFEDRLTEICANDYADEGPDQQFFERCFFYAGQFANLVRLFGGGPHEDAQIEHCKCCATDEAGF